MPNVNLSKNTAQPLYTKDDCLPLSGSNLIGKILVLDKSMLFGEYIRPEYQLVQCQSGYKNDTTKFRCDFIVDKEKSDFYLDEFIGELKPDLLPDWVVAELEKRGRTAERLARKEKADKKKSNKSRRVST